MRLACDLMPGFVVSHRLPMVVRLAYALCSKAFNAALVQQLHGVGMRRALHCAHLECDCRTMACGNAADTH
jgi:hypothetical protein